MSELGVVVVGIGIAGKVRCRNIGLSSEYACKFPELKGVQLKGFCSRRGDCSVEGVTKLNFEDALARPDVHCVVICTENTSHEEMARKALEAQKHVIVEFPLAQTFSVGKELFDLAHLKGVTLHEENILLLADHMKNVIATAKEKSVTKATMSSTAKVSRSSICMTEGAPVFSNRVHSLHCLLLSCGPLQAVAASVTFTEVGQGQRDLEARASLRSKDNAEIELVHCISHDPAASWSSTYEFEFADGTVLKNPPFERPKPPQPPVPGLFMQDFISFVGAIRDSAKTYLPEEISLEALKLADELQKKASKT